MKKQRSSIEYFVTAGMLIGIGALFVFLNEGINTQVNMSFALFQILQGVLVLTCGILICYQNGVEKKAGEPLEEGQTAEKRYQEALDTFNATIGLPVVVALVLWFYMLSIKPSTTVVGEVGALHLIFCGIVFLIFACIERWWRMLIETDADAIYIRNLLVLSQVSAVALFLDYVTIFTNVISISVYINYFIMLIFLYVAVMASASVGLKFFKQLREIDFTLYIVLPISKPGEEHVDMITWLEQNTGISMRSLWSIQFIRTALPLCAIGVMMLLWLSTCLVQIESYQRGALYHLGALDEEGILEPGLHFKLPSPLDTVEIYNTTIPSTMIVGYEGDVSNQNNLWTLAHEGEELTLLLGGGTELVAVNLKITYCISDLYAYLTNYNDPEAILNAYGYELVMNEVVKSDINTMISVDRSEFSAKMQDALKDYALQNGLGIEVKSVTLASIHPPIAIASIYQDVVSAGIQKRTLTLEAEAYALVAREAAEADSQVTINNAGISHDERVSQAVAEIAVYNAGIEAYLMDPDSYYLTKYLDTFETIMSQGKKYLVSPGINTSALYANFGASAMQGDWLTTTNGGY